MEHDLAAGRDGLVAVAHARQDDADRLRAALAHDVDLARRGVRPQQDARRGRVKRVPHVAGRVVRRHVEQFEVGQVVLDLPAAVNLEAEVGEDGVNLPQGLGGDVQAAAAHRPAGQRHVEVVGRQAAGQGFLFLPGQGLVVGLEQRLLDAVGLLPVGPALRLRDLTHFLDGQRDFPLLAEVARVPGPQGCLIGTGGQLRQGTLLEGREV